MNSKTNHPFQTLVKLGLASYLESKNLTLQDLENDLKNVNEKQASIEKEAAITPAINAIKAILSLVPEVLLPGALMGGTALGGTVLAAQNHLGRQDARINEKKVELDKIRQMTGQVRADYNN